MDIEIEEENYIDYLYQKYKDRGRGRIREKDRKEDIDNYNKSPIREYDLESDHVDSEEEAER